MPGTLIVDDTPLIRSTLMHLLRGEKLAPGPLLEACNGEEAVRLAQTARPELVFMDIRMPGLDGLQATALIRSQVPEARVVILTAYDDFCYAQKALKLGVQDYLLKPVRPEKLLETVANIAADLRQEQALVQQREGNGAVSAEARPVVETNLVENLIRGTMPAGETLAETLAYLQREISWPAVMVLKPDNLADFLGSTGEVAAHALYRQIAAITVRHLPEPERALLGFSSPGRIITILSCDGPLQDVGARRALGERIRQQVQKETPVTVTVGLGDCYPALVSIPISYAEANLARRACSSKGNTVVCSGDLQPAGGALSTLVDPIQLEWDLVQAIQENQPLLAQQLLDRILDALAQRHRDRLAPWQNHCAELVALAAWGVVNARVPAPRALGLLHRQVRGVAALQNVNEVRAWALNSLAELLCLIHSLPAGDPVVAAVAYLHQHYTRPDLSLNEIAEHVNLSPSHLSTLFKEQTGQTYIRTLTRLRVARACHLLRTTDDSVTAVAQAVGFRHTTNFYRHFQREEGTTPGNYRENG